MSGGTIRRNRCGRDAPRQWHERMLLDPAAEVPGLGVAHHLSRIADRLQIARDDFVKRRSFWAGDFTYWPGGTRFFGTCSCRLGLKPREIGTSLMEIVPLH